MTVLDADPGPLSVTEAAVERTAAATGERRAGWVDGLRAIAAMGVLVGHAYALGGRAVPIRAERWYDVPLLAATTGVWLFFAISGFVISRPFVEGILVRGGLPPLRGYAVRRAARIFPLFWLALSAYLLIEGAQGASGWQLAGHYLLLNNLIPGREQALLSVAWTLTLEVIFYAVLPLAALAVLRSRLLAPRELAGGGEGTRAGRLAGLLVVSWLASIVFTAGADLCGDGQIGLWLRGSFPAMWQMFCPGILLAILPHLPGDGRAGRLMRGVGGRGAAAAAGVILLVAVLVSTRGPLRFGVVPYQLFVDGTRPLFAIGYGIVVARALQRSGKPTPRLLLELGFASYGIYLIHPIVIDLLLRHPSLIPAAGASLGATFAHLAMIVALTVPAAMLSWRWLERPAIALARRIGRGR